MQCRLKLLGMLGIILRYIRLFLWGGVRELALSKPLRFLCLCEPVILRLISTV